jgi:NAD(P)-dependent dehydrogenase (short-subunit alcohol dehydrogenase family)
LDPSDILLTDQVAVVTGGGGGIGRAIALAFASVGADLVIGDIVPERCEETAARVRGLGRKALAVPTDVMETAQVHALIERAASELGRIDILVNNAGGVTPRPFIEQSERSWRRHIDLNLVSVLAASSAAVPIMIKGGQRAAPLSPSPASKLRARRRATPFTPPARPASTTSHAPWPWSLPITASASMPSLPT